MTFEVEIAGRTRTISIERAGETPGVYRVLVDGRPEVINAARVGAFGLSLMRESFTAEVQVTPAGRTGEVLVSLEGRTVPASLNGRRTGRAATVSAAHEHGEVALVAPMPGRVVRVLASPGDEVAARQPVVVIEAMKMENELRSPKAGRVKDVSVVAGMAVEAGKVLAVIE